jgi:hypothetical protein
VQDAYFCAKFVHLLHKFGYVQWVSPIFYDTVRRKDIIRLALLDGQGQT